MASPPSPPSPAAPPTGRRGRAWHRWLTVLASLLALAALVWVVGARSLWDRLRELDGRWMVVALAVTALQFVLMAARWCLFAARLGVPLRFRRALGEYYLSVLLNNVLPVGVVGDALRAFRHADHAAPAALKRPVATTLLAIVLERASGQLALVAVVLAGAPAWWRGTGAVVVRSWARIGLALALVALALLALWVFGRRQMPRLRRLISDGGRLFFAPHDLMVHQGLSFALLASHVALFIVAARAIGLDLSPGAAMIIVPPVLLASTFLALFGGFGTREAAAAALYHLAGGSAADGAAVAFVYGALSVLGSLPGLLALPWKSPAAAAGGREA